MEVLVPARARERTIISLVKEKTRWIAKKIREQSAIPPYEAKLFESGESFFYLGQSYVLQIVDGRNKEVRLDGPFITLTLRGGQAAGNLVKKTRRQLEQWFRGQAEDVLQDRVRKFSGLMGLECRSLQVRFYKSQWGNCSIKGDIKLNWRLILAPLEVLDYVVVHELSHIRHHNHSRAFWALVAHTMPDYKTQRAWLKTWGGTLRMD